MALLNDLVGLGMPPEQANKLAVPTIDALQIEPVMAAATAAGSTITDATLLTGVVNNVTTVGAGQGVKLNPLTPIGYSITVRNAGANNLTLYPTSANDQFNANTAGAGLTLTTVNKQIACCCRVSSTLWVTTVQNSV
jgi:hypothetical protein